MESKNGDLIGSFAMFENLEAYTNYTLKIYTKVDGSNITYLSEEINFQTKPDVPDCAPKVLKHGFIRKSKTSALIFYKVMKKYYS